MEDTIAAIATPQGAGGLGVIRISGPDAIEIGDRVTRPLQGTLSQRKGYTCAYGRVYDAQGELDEVVATVFRAPHSYTGEDVVELSVHGGAYLLQGVLRACCEAGARPAEAGEFTKRAFLNGKLDLTQAEAVADLISAQGRQSAKAALAARDGALFRKAKGIADLLVQEEAKLAAWIDYPEEDIEETQRASLEGSLQQAEKELSALLETYQAGKLLREGIDTVIAGRPNVGKSTLMNLLTDSERSIVTDIPGTTRDVVTDTVRMGNLILHLSDTAGIRETKDLVEQAGVERTKNALQKAQLVLAVFDGSSPLKKEDEQVIRQCRDAVAVALVNKNDLPQQMAAGDLAETFDHIIPISAKEGKGAKELQETLEGLFLKGDFDPQAANIANERQLEAVRKAEENVREALAALQSGVSLDAVGVCMEEGANALLQLTGEKAGEAVVNEIFSRFCVGK